MQGVAKITATYKKIIVGLILITVITMPGEIAGTLHEVLNLGYEGISFVLEELIQHVFHVNKYITQSIVFYLWLSAILFGLYYFWRILPDLSRQFKNHTLDTWLQVSTDIAAYWRGLTLIRKIGVIVLYLAGIYLIFSVLL